MKKTLVALAALASVSAFAQSTVTLSGRASMDYSTWGTKGVTTGANDFENRARIADTSSRIAIAVNEDLGGGQRAGVYCETGMNIDTANNNGQANTANPNTNTFCSREGRAYLGQGDYELRLGRQNVWWTQGELNQVGSTYLGSDAFTNLQNGGVGVLGVRLENMAKFAVTGGAFAGSEIYTGKQTLGGEAAAVNTDSQARYNGFKAVFTQGQLVAMIDQQTSKGTAAVAATAADATVGYAGTVGADRFDRKATKYGLGFKYAPDSMISAQYWTKKRTDQTNPNAAFTQPIAVDNTATGSGKDSGYGFVLKHSLGGGLTLHAQWGKAKDLKDVNGAEVADTGAKAVTLGLTKALSKRTHIYTAYHKITNEAAGIYGMTGGNYASGTARPGADTKQVAVGFIHNF